MPPVRTARRERVVVGASLLATMGVVAAANVTGRRAVLAAALVTALPLLLRIARRFEPAWLLSAGIGLSVFSGNWAHIGVPGGLDRPMLLAGILAVALRAREPEYRRMLRVEPVHWVLALAALYALGSAFWVDVLGDRKAVFQLLDRFGLIPFAMFFVAPAAFRTERQRGILIGVLVVVGGYLGLTALMEALNLNALIFPHYILDPTVGITTNRARGPFADSAANGLALYGCLIAAGVAVVVWRDRGARIVAGAVGAVCAVGLIFTLTRAIWLASVCATVVMVLSLPALRRRLVPLLGGGVALVLVALAVVPGLGAKAQRRQDDQQPVWDRLNSDSAALRAIEDKPLLGVGWSRFGIASTPYFRQAADYPLTGVGIDAHNLFLSNAVELGLLGTLLWAIGLVGALGGAVAARAPPELALWRLGLVGLAIHWLVVANFGPVAYAFPNVLLWTWAGIVFGHRLTRTAAGAVARPRGLPLLAEPDALYAGGLSTARFGRPV